VARKPSGGDLSPKGRIEGNCGVPESVPGPPFSPVLPPAFGLDRCLRPASRLWLPPSLFPSSGMGPREGWPSNQPDHPPRLHVPPLSLSPTLGPALQHGCPAWPPRSCRLGRATPSPSRGRHRSPPPGPYTFPRYLCFYSKALTVTEAGTCLPPTSGPQKARC
jgi:hypothetical protein